MTQGKNALVTGSTSGIGLRSQCLEESQKAIHAGQHLEGRRLDILARQLQQRADAKRN